jgi:hypothetical protein
MALLGHLVKGATTPTGLLMGIGAALLLPVVAPVAATVLRPAAKALVRTGITLYRSTIEPVTGAIGDLVTEVQVELAAGSRGAAPQRVHKDAAPQPVHEDAAPQPVYAAPQPVHEDQGGSRRSGQKRRSGSQE